MNWQIFGIIGYLGILLSVAALALWLVYWAKPKRLWVNLAFILVLLAFFCARINSDGYVDRIDVDPAEKRAEVEARQKAKEQALINSRSDEVAQIRFAEDDQGDFMDTAGMDEADLKYLKAISEPEIPEWKKNKKVRGSAGEKDESLESMIDGEEADEGVDVADLEAEQKAEPILMNEADVVLANKLDLWNLKFSELLFWIAIFLLILDYLRRANRYEEASFPIPLPSGLLNAFTPLPVIRERPATPRRSMEDELKWLTLRGDAFIYFCDQPGQGESTSKALNKFYDRPFRLDLVQVNEDPTLTGEFIFEALWYGRTSFIVDSQDKAEAMLKVFIARLEKRLETKARTAQSVHLVWDIDRPIPKEILEKFTQWAEPAGYSLMIRPSHTS